MKDNSSKPRKFRTRCGAIIQEEETPVSNRLCGFIDDYKLISKGRMSKAVADEIAGTHGYIVLALWAEGRMPTGELTGKPHELDIIKEVF